MKDELQTKLAEILTAIQASVAKGTDFALEQLPDIAQQYLLYGKVWAIITVLVMLATNVLIAWVTLKFGYRSKQTDDYGDWANGRLTVSLIGTVSLVFTIPIFLSALQELLLIHFAPKVWLLKEVMELLK